NIKEILIKNPADIDWTAEQIINLYRQSTFDSESDDPLPYTHCPQCGSEELNRGMHTDNERDENYFVITCKKCKWSEVTQ
ncbi:MAG TPA: hypothetical protein DDW49_01420, partial [Deltaproteobacteria bacterium]|nr:hypothetical protein [Deltaproteobacteria bacterium]